jgi:ribosomal protein S18 acetylase RimI-like enzyme
MAIVDWRELPAARVAPLYEEQMSQWASGLGWSLAASWSLVEQARTAGALPGMAWVNARGGIEAWTFFMRQQSVVQIGALAGRRAAPVRELLEAILEAPEAAGARELTCLLYPARPNAVSALTRRRFVLQPLGYFSRTISAGAEPHSDLPGELVARRWREDDAVSGVRLLARAYAVDGGGRNLAPNGTLEEWAHYLGQILSTPACGVLLPRGCFIVEERRTGTAVGLLLATSVGEGTAHVAQLAVDPKWTRRGVGRSLLRLAAHAVRADGMERLTLLVSGQNNVATRLYVSEGFEEAGRMVFASRLMPVRRQVAARRAA